MRVLISADMEGTCGVSSWIHVDAPEETSAGRPHNQAEYERFRAQMTDEVNAAIEGALEGGATGVIVNDSHDGQRNILGERLHRDATYISGSDKPYGMMQGIDASMDAVFFTGYHAKAGTPGAPLAHTWNGWLKDLRFNGESTGEFGLNGAIAGAFGVPVVLVCGDDQAVQQTQDCLGKQVQGAVVKWGISSTAARHLHPEVAQKRIREAARDAMAVIGEAKPYEIGAGCQVELEADHQSRIDQMLLVPGGRRTGDRTAAFLVNDGRELIQLFRLCCKVGSIPMTP